MNITPFSSRQSINLSISSESTPGRAILKTSSGTTNSKSGLVNNIQNLSIALPNSSPKRSISS